MIPFKIYYDNGATYTGDPFYAPPFGVLVIVEVDPSHGSRLIHSADYYCLDDRGEGEAWWESDYAGLVDYLASPGPKKVVFGRLVSNTLFQEIFQKATSDPDFPEKTAYSLRHHGRKA